MHFKRSIVTKNIHPSPSSKIPHRGRDGEDEKKSCYLYFTILSMVEFYKRSRTVFLLDNKIIKRL